MDNIFQNVYEILKWISKISGLTYHEVNIIVYYIVIPGILIYLLGKILKRKLLIIAYGALVLLTITVIPDFEVFSTKLFEISADFLNSFEQIGLNYTQASVVICVIFPILVTFILIYLSNRKRLNKKRY